MSPKARQKTSPKGPLAALKQEKLFDASPVPDRFSSPKVNKIAKSVFNAPPGANPVLPENPLDVLQSSCPETPTMEPQQRSIEIETTVDAATAAAAVTAIECATPQNAPSTTEGSRSAEKPQFAVGDVVWAQTDAQFPFWPAYVIDPSQLPEDLQQAYHFTAARNGKSNKIPVYFYGRNDYDVVNPTRMRDYLQHRDALDKQKDITGSLYIVFRRGVRIANDHVLKDPSFRMEWMQKGRSDSVASKEGNPTISRTGSSSTHSSRSNSRASSIMINTDTHDVITSAMSSSSGALQMSPLSDTPNSLFSSSSADGARGASRFAFPEYPLSVSLPPQLETVAECTSVTSDTPAPTVQTTTSSPDVRLQSTSFSVEAAPDDQSGSHAEEAVNISLPVHVHGQTDAFNDIQSEVLEPVEEQPAQEVALGADNYEIVDLQATETAMEQSPNMVDVALEESAPTIARPTQSASPARPPYAEAAGLFGTARHTDDLFGSAPSASSDPFASPPADTHAAAFAPPPMYVPVHVAPVEDVFGAPPAGHVTFSLPAPTDAAQPPSFGNPPAESRSDFSTPSRDASFFGHGDLSADHHNERDTAAADAVEVPVPGPQDAQVQSSSPPRSSPTRPQSQAFLEPPVRLEPFSAYSSPSRDASFFGHEVVSLNTPGRIDGDADTVSTSSPSAFNAAADVPNAPMDIVSSIFGGPVTPPSHDEPPEVNNVHGTLPSAPMASVSSMFGGPATPPSSRAPPAVIAAPANKLSDASSLFGNSSHDLFAAPSGANAMAAPAKERVAGGGRAAVVSAGKGLFDNAPAAADGLFGSAPAASSHTSFGGTGAGSAAPKKVVPVTRGAASDLFASAPADSNPFGAPVSAPPAVLPSAHHPFTGPPPAAHNPFGGPSPVPSNAFGGNHSAPSKSSPARPVNDAASLFGDSGASAGPFGFGAAPAAADVFGAAPAPPAPRPAAADMFGAPPAATATPAFTSPPAVAPAPHPFEAPAPPPVRAPVREAARDAPPAFVTTPSSAQAEETSAECVSSPGAEVDSSAFFGAATASVPPVSAPIAPPMFMAAPPIVPKSSPFAPTAAAKDAFSQPPMEQRAPSPVPAPVPPVVPISRAATEPVSALPSTAPTAPAVAAPSLNRTSSSGPAFKGRATLVSGASPFDTPGPANTADVLFRKPTAPSGDPFGGHNVAASSLFGASSAGADPFASAPAGGDAAAAFSTLPAGVPASSFGGASNVFGAPPPGAGTFNGAPPSSVAGGSMSAKKTTKGVKVPLSASDVFGGAAPVEVKPYATMPDAFSPPTAPGVKAAPRVAPAPVAPLPPANPTASPQVHGKGAAAGAFGAAPSDSHSSVPPSPAGVSNMSLQYPNGGLPSPVPAHGAAGSPHTNNAEVSGAAALPPASSTIGKYNKAPPASKVKKPVPPGMIATPHGYVPIASLQPGYGGPAANEPPAPVPAIASQPLVKHSVLTSLVTETAPEVVEQPAAADVFSAQPTTAAGASAVSATSSAQAQAAGRNKHVRPIGPVVSFGFGGKVLAMFPKTQHRHMPAFNPAYGVPAPQPVALPTEGRTYHCGPVRVHALVELVRNYTKNESVPAIAGMNAPFDAPVEDTTATAAVSETMELCKLLTLFPGPLTSQPPAAANADGHDADALVREVLQSRIDRPLSRTLKQDKRSSDAKQTELATSEKLLWTLLKLCVDRGGVLTTDSADSSAGGEALAPEVKVIQLLLGHAPTAAATVPGGGAAVSVFSGSAATSITSYAPDMTKPKELHANFTPKQAATTVGAEQYSEIEALLVVGRREDALKKAIQCGEWSLAILIGSVCGAEKYQEVIRSYSASHFPASAPLHLLTLMYTNQATSAVVGMQQSDDVLSLWRHNLSSILSNKPSNWQQLAQFLGYRLLSESKDVFAAHSAYLSAGALPTFPTVSSSSSSAHIGVRGSGNASTYSSTDSLPGHEQKQTAAELDATAHKLAGKYALLGCDVTLPRHRSLADCLSISALRGSEVLEYTLVKRLQAQTAAQASGLAKSPSTDGIAAIGKSLTDIFSWSSNSSSAVPPKSPRAGAAASAAASHPTGNAGAAGSGVHMDAQLKYKVTKVRVVLCPLKVRFAMILADFGLLKEAAAYALEARSLVQEVGVAEEKGKADKTSSNKPGTGPPTAASGKSRPVSTGSANTSGNTSSSGGPAQSGELTVKPFNRNFVRALDEFIDRLGLSEKVRATSTPTAAGATHKRESSSTGSTSLWGSMISSINLKDLVDNMTDAPPTASAPPVGAGAPPTQAHGAPPTASHKWPQPPSVATGGGGAADPFSSPPAHNNAPPQQAASPLPPPSQVGQNASHYAAMSSMPPRPGSISLPPPGTGEHRAPPAFGASTPNNNDSDQQNEFFEDVDLSQESRRGNHNAVPVHGHSASHYPPQQAASPYGASTNASAGPSGPPRGASHRDAPNMSIPAPINTAPPSMWGGSTGAPSAHNSSAHNSSAHNSASPAAHQSSHQSSHPPVHPPHNAGSSSTHNSAPSAPHASIPPSTSTSNFFGFGGSTAAPATTSSTTSPVHGAAAGTPKAAPATTGGRSAAPAKTDDDEGKSGIFGNLRKGMLKYLYPDAHDASEHIGKSLDAVYNKETGRWEFPGEEGNGAPSPASLPPPTGPMGGGSGGNSGSNSLGVSPSPSMSAFGNVGGGMPPPGGMMGGIASGPPGAMGNNAPAADYDPMAALMAPPSRRMPSSYSSASLQGGAEMDPLAALMAPPSMARYSMPPPSTAGNSPGMPPINVWKPPPVMMAAAPAPAAMLPQGDSATTGASDSSTPVDGPPLGPPPLN